jgi:hypothetical protein
MLTEYDIQALIELLQRTHMTKPEQLFAGRLIDTLMTLIEKPADSPEEHHDIPHDDSGGKRDGPDHEPE